MLNETDFERRSHLIRSEHALTSTAGTGCSLGVDVGNTGRSLKGLILPWCICRFRLFKAVLLQQY